MSHRKLVLYIAASLDGYIATNEHNLDWLLTVEGEGDNGYGTIPGKPNFPGIVLFLCEAVYRQKLICRLLFISDCFKQILIRILDNIILQLRIKKIFDRLLCLSD